MRLYVRLFVHLPFKWQLVQQLAHYFATLTPATAQHDDDDDQARLMLEHLSVQVFTVPVLAARLAHTPLMEQLLRNLHEWFDQARDGDGRLNTSHLAFEFRRFWRLFVNIDYLLAPHVAQHVVFSPSLFAHVRALLAAVQYADG